MKFAVVLLRWFLAAGCLYFSVRQMSGALKADGFAAAPALFFGISAFITAVLLISPETIVRICEFCSRPLAAIIYPNATADKPPLSYRLAHRYRKQMRLGEAAEEYQRIIRYYPGERSAYLELLALAKEVDHPRLYKKYARLYLRRFKAVPFAEERVPEKLASGE